MSWLWGNWIRLVPWAVALLAVLAGWVYVQRQRAEISGLQQRLAVAAANGALAEKLARNNAAALDMAARQHAADDAAIQAHFEREAQADKSAASMLERIDHAAQGDDGPVAPVLEFVFDCLRSQARDATGAGGADCAPQASGAAAGLPGDAAGTAPR